MNIRQYKEEFTLLTGLPAKKKSISSAIWQNRGHVRDWISFGRGYSKDNPDFLDSRTSLHWEVLVSYIKCLQEVFNV